MRYHSKQESIRWQMGAAGWALVSLLVLSASLGEAVVKQPRSDENQQQSQQQQQQVSSSQNQANSQQQQQVSNGGHAGSSQASAQQQQSSSSSSFQTPQQQSSSSSSASSYLQAAPKSSQGGFGGLDSMSASEHSYQAAANSVNQALANSGIFSTGSNYQPTGSQQQASQQQQQQASSSPSMANPSQGLNHVHYLYYPSKEASSQQQQAAVAAQKDSMSSFQPASYGPSYADQLSSALSSMAAAGGPDVAASSQDPSYLPQPQGSQQQQPQPPVGSDQFGASQMQPSPHQFQPDQSAYTGNQQGGSVTFGGSSDQSGYLPQNAHQQQQPQQQQQQQPGYQPNGGLYGQMSGDMANSHFGNSAGPLSSASYLSPQQQQPTNGASDMSGFNMNSFSSQASQLAPAAVAPPAGLMGSTSSMNQQQQQPHFSSNAANANNNNLFGPQSIVASQQGLFSQQGQQQAANSYNLGSFLTPAQYSQLTGQPMAAMMDQMGVSGSAPAASAALAPAASGTSTAAATTSASGKRFGISHFIMPMLALAGLSLLIPTMSNIGTAVGRRKKRSTSASEQARQQQEIAYEPLLNGPSQLLKEASIGEYMDRIERYYSIYQSAVESDDCLNRLICEFGDAVKDIGGKSAVVTVIEKLVPAWMTGKVHLFKEAALDQHKEGKEKCKKYVCQSNKRRH